ncbi:N-acetyltransferase family protein (plasmid) [Bacillus thuringiensis serovar kurstaki]|uniref:N-hydroxyarylamine O-acetyltransferase n=2 Tax=Bacillus cereus group TaxID=86661 RepID=A0A9W5QFU4_BACCE|nr:N-hydroxyarylamine O-acetyltransferase [Bacillus thuringiensis serovar chinensis CT-43]AGG05048.1 N-hydroxyarylamine O-acetyltransferase [Bacillus thuringiensis serovar thuringiensis str. IS5056]AHZ55005.1 N-hydroxyarylamine O-acetyltransferase [Bacillus thuringiensis serovar kurstaki str. YBT-1520]AIE37453.1 N-hydroxyarylamine O-acetyltransferase [Bacillus thuringiensis serovar kurstaki str. HD-1]AJK37954.1 N-acetyltransferase family protein [Bacillus thuringiensis serovar kurstaki]EOP2901
MLTELQKNFLSKLKISSKESIQFDTLHQILLQMAHLIPCENIDIMEGHPQKISRVNLEEKLLLNNHGGLCML